METLMYGCGRPLATAEDLLRMREPLPGLWHELDHGALVVREAGGLEHGDIAALLVIRMGAYVYEHELGRVVGSNVGFLLTKNPDTVRVPDAAFVRADRIPCGALSKRYVDGAPDLAIEVMSPNDRFSELARKATDYLRAGGRLVWGIRPYDRRVIVWRANGEMQTLTLADTLDGEDVLPGFRCRVASLFV